MENNSKEVHILGALYTIKYVKDLPKKAGVHGDCNSEQELIRVNRNASEGSKYRTEAHEISHALLAVSGLTELLTPELEEAFCVMMEYGYKSYLHIEE